MINGVCVCCDIILAFPEDITTFVCTICGQVNDRILSSPSTQRDQAPFSLDKFVTFVEEKSPWDPSFVDIFRKKRLLTEVCAAVSEDWFLAASRIYKAIESIKDENFELGTHILSAMMELLKRPYKESLGHDANSSIYLLILILYPGLYKQNIENLRIPPLSRLFGLISGFPDKSIIRSFFMGIEKPQFERFVDLANQVISSRLQLNMNSRSDYQRDWALKAAARFLSLLFTFNEESKQRRLPVSAFYNTFVDLCDLRKDFENWATYRNNFSLMYFSSYPFLISMGSKMTILEADAARQMMTKMAESYIQLIRGVPESPFLIMSIRRQHLIRDSLNQLQQNAHNLKKKLFIQFDGEEGIDAGGLTKEWFLLLVRRLFDPMYGMFTYDEESNLCWFSMTSLENREEFHLVGVVIGLSIYNATILDVPLPPICFKKLLQDSPPTLEDLSALSPTLARGFQQMLHYDNDDFEDVFPRTFVAEYEYFGDHVQVPLTQGGESMYLTKQNRRQFVDLYLDWKFNSSIQSQFQAFREGFYQVASQCVLSLFHPQEIELLVRGSPELDFQALELTAVFNGVAPDDNLVKWFWEIIHSLTEQEKRRFLSFVTGSDRVPATGIERLVLKISLLSDQDSESLPISHTCFNEIGLHRYATQEKMKTKLLQAIDWSSGFHVK